MQILQEAKVQRSKKTNKVEEVKLLKTPMSVYKKLETICSNGLEALADEDASFFLKCFGLFLKKDGLFMLRIRIPAGQLNAKQAIKLGEVAHMYGEDYIDITTRQQLEFRFLKLEDLYKVFTALDSVGITTFQTGIDNFRNIVTSSFDGLGKESMIICKPLIDDLQSIFLKNEAWIGVLPRKFNTAILGNTTNDCNIYGHDCCFVLAQSGEVTGFNLYLGGKVGVQASKSGLFVRVEEVVPTYNAIINLFKTYGFRDNRNKNRLHFLLEAVGMEAFVEAIKTDTCIDYLNSGETLATKEYLLDESGVFDLDDVTKAVHLCVPSGIFKGSDLIKIGALAKSVDGEIRFSVEQSLYIVTSAKNVAKVQAFEIYKRYEKFQNTYFNHQIACAGTATCAFGVIPNKPDAIEMAHYLQQEIPIRGAKVRMYWSACPKGCGIHGVADIGFEGCNAKDKEGNKVDGVHIFIGGKATNEAKEARVLYKSVPLKEAKYKVRRLMELYRDERKEDESFESYDTRVLSLLSCDDIIARLGV